MTRLTQNTVTFTLAQESEVVGDDLLAVPTGETEYTYMYCSTQNRFQLPEVMPEVIPELPGLSSRDIDVYSEVLPSLLQYGGDMLTYHVNSVMSRPQMLQNVAEKISAYVTGVEDEAADEGPGSRHVLDLIREAGLEGEEHRVVSDSDNDHDSDDDDDNRSLRTGTSSPCTGSQARDIVRGDPGIDR